MHQPSRNPSNLYAPEGTEVWTSLMNTTIDGLELSIKLVCFWDRG